MNLEEQFYEFPRKEKTYTIGDLEKLSASVLYISGPSEPLGSNFLTIRDFSASGFQLHIHEGANGTAHIWDYKRQKKTNISSYDAAMMDLVVDHLKENGDIDEEEIRKILKKW